MSNLRKESQKLWEQGKLVPYDALTEIAKGVIKSKRKSNSIAYSGVFITLFSIVILAGMFCAFITLYKRYSTIWMDIITVSSFVLLVCVFLVTLKLMPRNTEFDKYERNEESKFIVKSLEVTIDSIQHLSNDVDKNACWAVINNTSFPIPLSVFNKLLKSNFPINCTIYMCKLGKYYIQIMDVI